MKHVFKRHSKLKTLSAIFKGRIRSPFTDKPPADDQNKDFFRISSMSGCVKKDEISLYHNANKKKDVEYLGVLHRILQEQVINTTELYSISGHTVRVEVLEDTEL